MFYVGGERGDLLQNIVYVYQHCRTVLIKHHQIITRNHIRYILDKSNAQILINYSTISISISCYLIGKRSSSLGCTLHCMPQQASTTSMVSHWGHNCILTGHRVEMTRHQIIQSKFDELPSLVDASSIYSRQSLTSRRVELTRHRVVMTRHGYYRI